APFGPRLTNAPFTLTTANLYAGAHSVRATVTDAFGVEVTSPGNRLTILPATAGAVFRQYDFAAHGAWRGIYGSEGYVIINFATNLPAYATARPIGSSSVTWTSETDDPRALQKPAGTDRFAGAWYSYTNEVL